MDLEVKKLIVEAIEAIKQGDIEEGLLILERTVDPKFRSVNHALGSYLMRDGLAGINPTGSFFAEALGHQVGS
ncbi:hypothetical protein PCC82_11575 [Agrobacterium deltaense]